MPRDIKRENDRKLYLAGASRQQVMKKHRTGPKTAKPKRINMSNDVPLSKGQIDRLERDKAKRVRNHLAGKPTEQDHAREQAALDEWRYLNRD